MNNNQQHIISALNDAGHFWEYFGGDNAGDNIYKYAESVENDLAKLCTFIDKQMKLLNDFGGTNNKILQEI
ncbi:MAG: hypothetical protein IJ848_00315 [Alphaproteobacteria bacterium]|nr:hypothetical protein [Alphaproteobacteria bacterium]